VDDCEYVKDSIYNVEVAVGIVLARGEVHLALDRQDSLMVNAATLKSLNNSSMIESMWKTVLRRESSGKNSFSARRSASRT
jgi:hypothetical protein